MSSYRGFVLGLCIILSVSMLGTGCRKNKGKMQGDGMGGLDGTGQLDPFGESAYSMGDGARPDFSSGVPITDVSFQAVSFEYDSYQLAPSEYGKIDVVADYMTQNADTLLVTEGHCDERGSREYNLALGENRAQAVRAYLINVGIDGERIQTRSHGEEMPIDSGHTESSWAQNRRVEFSLFR